MDTPVIHDPYTPLADGAGASETSFAVNLAALVLSVGLASLAFLGGVKKPLELCILLVVALLVTSVSLETLCFRRSALRRLRVRSPLSFARVAFRETGLLATFGVIALAYWLFPAFGVKDMTLHYYPFLTFVVPALLALSVPYFCLMDLVDAEEEDALCRVGRAILTFRPTMTRFEFANFARSWLVKAFWLSLMQPAFVEKIRVFLQYRYDRLAGSPLEIYAFATAVCFGIDLCYAASGYALNFRLFNTHTRTAEPTLAGWAAAICCYWPFWAVLFCPYFFKYETAVNWTALFPTGSALWWTWAALIVGLEFLYAMATVAGGIRFSNLTYRGLWNTGPYRWTKHPAYVFKNISWWLIAMPFAVNSGAAAVKCTLLLLGVNAIYFLRARTEERHLSHYPEYVAYALAMNERSIFRWCAKLLPFLRYRAPGEETLWITAASSRP